MLSNRIQKLRPSATLAINARAIELKKQGVDILKFGTGEPDFDTPEHIKDAAKQALDEGFTKYTNATGIPELKAAVAEKFKRDNNIICAPEDVIISVGGKQALYNIFMALLNPGDEVLLPAPYWVSYADMILVCDGVVKTIDTRANRFKLTAKMVEKAITSKTRALALNSPGNPTGMIVDREEIEKIAELAQKHQFYVISDEVYEYFLYDGRQSFSIASLPEMKDWVFTVNAVSKTYSMTGWRIGYMTGPREFIKPISSLQSHSTSNPCSIAQKAALAAITGPQDCIKEMVAEFEKRRNFVHEAFNKIPGFKLEKPEGAFYAFPDISDLKVHNSFALAELLMEKARVAVVPGGAFGEEGDQCIRFSFASSMADIKEGLKRIKESLA
ncbi:MAG: pyridoxal phosphate-dependent aminotransferase [Patescibacteria group bacterium]